MRVERPPFTPRPQLDVGLAERARQLVDLGLQVRLALTRRRSRVLAPRERLVRPLQKLLLPLPVELAHNVVEEAAHFLDAVAVALAALVRSIDEAPPRVEVADRCAVQVALVALPQACVLPELDVASLERDLRSLDRASQAIR
jgi:hypothetical protein